MRVPRIYTAQALTEHSQFDLDEAASHHCLKVLRMDVGRELILFNGLGGEYQARIVGKDKKVAKVEATGFEAQNYQSNLDTHLGIALSRGERFDLVLQKATELGVTTITPLFTERTEVKLSGERLAKKTQSWQKILIAACEQCGRNILPELDGAKPLSQFLTSDESQMKLVLHHRNSASPANLAKPGSVSLLIGPEGGLSEQEIEQAHGHGFQNLALGPRVLRTETAPIAALAIMQQLWGDI